MIDQALLGSDGSPVPLPPDPLSPVPDEVERALAAYRAGDVPAGRARLTTIAGAGRTAVSGHAAMALAGIELTENGLGDSCRTWLEHVVTGEDPWLGPLAAVMLSADFQPYTSTDSDPLLLRSLAAQLTGDLEAARTGFEQAVALDRDLEVDEFGNLLMEKALASLLLGNLLLQSGDPSAALKPLTYARDHFDGLFAGYAGYLEGHVLIGLGEANQAGEVLSYAHRESHPARGGSKGLHPWVAIRFGELLAGDPFSIDLIYDQMENSAISMGEVIREPFESAYSRETGSPALADIGLFLFPAVFEPVHAGLERLKTWSDERYERGRRLVLALHTHVDNSRNDQRARGLAELREKLDLPRPHR